MAERRAREAAAHPGRERDDVGEALVLEQVRYATGHVYDSRMPTDLLTAAKIAVQLKASAAKVKNTIAALKLKPAAKKGPCSYYASSDVAKIKKALG